MYIYPDVKYLEILHKKIIEKGLDIWEGGSFWYIWWRDISDLKSVVEFIKNDDYYETFEDKLTQLVYSINKNHIFADGNKRGSIYFWAYFLEINSLEFLVERFLRKMENFTVYVADNKINKNLLHKIIYSLIYEDDYTEELQLEIYNAIKL